MKTSLALILPIALLVNSSSFAAQKVGSCEPSDRNSIYSRYDFLLEGQANGGSLIIEGVIGSQDSENGAGIRLQQVALNPKTVKENSSNALKVKDGKQTLSINHKSGEGQYKYAAWELSCSPGQSEWCVIKFPTFVRVSQDFARCQIQL